MDYTREQIIDYIEKHEGYYDFYKYMSRNHEDEILDLILYDSPIEHLKKWSGIEEVENDPEEQEEIKKKAKERWGDDWRKFAPTKANGGIDWAALRFTIEE